MESFIVFVDLIIALTQASAFNISQSTSFSQRECDVSDQELRTSICQTGPSSVGQFAEAMKASLLSSDTQVQVKSLEVINFVYSMSLEISEEIQSLVNEGLTDYIVEVLRISDAIKTKTFETGVSASSHGYAHELLGATSSCELCLFNACIAIFCSPQTFFPFVYSWI
uniref:Uncharacterized protein n=1 Tax=Physcomitrium patens TaxID=3218 RepID=A0A2K1L8P0_PHYPA|nr:hypothetical protein PHYPA_000829 [Physcomitrium patens]